jgi:hypothetical protein
MPGMVLFLLGVATAILGLACLFIKDIKILKGEELKPVPRILIGVFLLSFFPLVLAVNPLLYDLNVMASQIIQWGLWFFCVILAGLVLMLASRSARRIRRTSQDRHPPQPSSFSGSNEDANNSFRLS